MSVILAAIGILGMIGSVASSGADAGKNADQIRDQITQIKNRTASLKSKFEEVIKGGQKFTAEMEASIQSDVDQLKQNTAQTKIYREQFLIHKQRIQMSGIIFIVAVFFLMLLKRLGLLDAIDDLIMSPFQGGEKSAK